MLPFGSHFRNIGLTRCSQLDAALDLELDCGFSASKDSKDPVGYTRLELLTVSNWPGPFADPESSPNVKYPTCRRVLRRPTDLNTPLPVVQAWFNDLGVTLGPLVTDDLREDVMRTLFTYRDINAVSVGDVSATDLFVHEPRLAPGTKPWAKSRRKRWTAVERYWLDRLVSECLEAGIFEYTMVANGRLSDWSAEPVLVPKTDNPWDENRLTFNHRYVFEVLPGVNITLLAEVHDYLSDPRVGSFCSFDCKHAYWSVLVKPESRHLFAFTVPGYAQLQPTRMPQGTRSAGFSMTELMTFVLGPIPGPHAEPSLLVPGLDGCPLPPVDAYMDDVFCAFPDFKSQWSFIKQHLLLSGLGSSDRWTNYAEAKGHSEDRRIPSPKRCHRCPKLSGDDLTVQTLDPKLRRNVKTADSSDRQL
ncbi:hypothetical protein CDD82_7155 [Ophiocordyceps australis]|uniref:Reverse transcriptase domain-containing protein n=1 Tax=Ophiocordyceps australis TaxID=1399860 RepID=A0A2C5YU23_9HYPO|nr:hypothetical protein CDD82_7155 [Ophiocordyceps australis]